MTPDEALRLCRIAKSISPAQAVDEFMPDAWALILRDISLTDAEDALRQLGGEQEWIHVSHIVKRVKRIRGARVDKHLANVPIPSGLNPAEYHRWYRATVKSIADGAYEPEPPAAIDGPKRDIRELGAVKSPEADRIKALREEAAKGRKAAQAVKADERASDRAADAEDRKAKRAAAEAELAGLRDRLAKGQHTEETNDAEEAKA